MGANKYAETQHHKGTHVDLYFDQLNPPTIKQSSSDFII